MKFNSTPLCFGIAASLMVMAAVEAQPPQGDLARLMEGMDDPVYQQALSRAIKIQRDMQQEQGQQRGGRPYGTPHQPQTERQGQVQQASPLDLQLYSASEQLDLGKMQQLIQQGASAQSHHPQSGDTALHVVARLNYGDPAKVKAVMQLLLNAGAMVDTQNKNGRTPLNLASLFVNRAAAEFLLAHGADPRFRDPVWLQTPLDMTQDPQNPLHVLFHGRR